VKTATGRGKKAGSESTAFLQKKTGRSGKSGEM
jgi:hypothetical protein